MKKFIFSCLWVLYLVLPHSFAATPTSVGPFYRTSTGNVAFIPYARSREDAMGAPQYHELGESGDHTLRKQDEYWFVVNHRVSGQTEISYLGVEIIKVRNSPVSTPLFLSRNKNWVRSDDPDFDGTVEDRRSFSQISQKEFYELHEEELLVGNFDAALEGFKWHATPEGGTKNSWARKDMWRPTFDILSSEFHSRFNPPIEANSDLFLNARLIRFSTTNKLSTENPLLFNIDGANTDAVYIKMFSPDAPEFERIYFLTFR